jgi:hypothetical protein
MYSIKDHHLYPLYIEYLKRRKLSKGAFELSKISEDYFFDFKFRYDTDEGFRDKQDKFFKSIIRENKINNILDDKLHRSSQSR